MPTMTPKVNVRSHMRLSGGLVLGVNMSAFPDTPELGSLVMMNGGLYVYQTFGGSTAWYPLIKSPTQYDFQQTAPATEWDVSHNLGAADIWYLITDSNGYDMTPSDVQIVDNNNLKLFFTEAVQGKVLVLAAGVQGTQGAKGDPGMKWQGAYSAATAYAVDDVVYYGGSSYICTVACTNVVPTTAANWSMVAEQGAQGPVGPNDTLVTNAASGTATTIDLSTATVEDLTLSANCTLTFANKPANAGNAFGFSLVVRQDATGSRAVTWPASVKWQGGSAPALSTAASAIDLFSFVTTDNGTNWLGIMSGKGFA